MLRRSLLSMPANPSDFRIPGNVNMHHQATATVLFGIVVGGVMRNMAVDHPFAWLERRPDYVVALSGSDIDSVSLKASCGRQCLAVAGDHDKRATMNVHRVYEAAVGADEPDLERFAHFHLDCVGRRIGAAIDREVVRHPAFHGHRRIRQAIPHQPLL